MDKAKPSNRQTSLTPFKLGRYISSIFEPLSRSGSGPGQRSTGVLQSPLTGKHHLNKQESLKGTQGRLRLFLLLFLIIGTGGFYITFSEISKSIDGSKNSIDLSTSWKNIEPLQLKSVLERPGKAPVKRKPCVKRRQAVDSYVVDDSVNNGFLVVDLNGGLNQQRRGIANAVVVARILNATLVLPRLLKHTIWQDSSSFKDLFDLEHFIKSLRDDIRIVRTLPPEYEMPPDDYELPNEMLEPSWYLDNILPILKDSQVIWFHTFYTHLAQDLPISLQRLRCRAQYRALRFISTIRKVGESVVEQLRQSGPYIAMHLRFEPDEVAHSGCMYNDENLVQVLKAWGKGRSSKYQYKPDPKRARELQRQGLCPLTPSDAALTLKALGVQKETIYLAGGEPAGGQAMLQPLVDAFPNQVVTKSDLVGDQLAALAGSPSKLAAIDYIASLHSDFLLITAGGNMATMLRGHRFFEGDEKETYQPHWKFILPFMQQNRVDFPAVANALEKQRIYVNGLPRVWTERRHFFDRPQECVCETKLTLQQMPVKESGHNKQSAVKRNGGGRGAIQGIQGKVGKDKKLMSHTGKSRGQMGREGQSRERQQAASREDESGDH